MSKLTISGPWSFRTPPTGATDYDAGWLWVECDGRIVARVATGFDQVDLARLIAAAPELLHALKRARTWLGKAIADGAFDNCVVPGASRDTLEEVDAAIAKATE